MTKEIKTVRVVYSVYDKNDARKIDLLCRHGKLVNTVTVFGVPVYRKYELEGAHDREGNQVLVKATVVL